MMCPRPSASDPSRQEGATLIELMVGIAILSALLLVSGLVMSSPDRPSETSMVDQAILEGRMIRSSRPDGTTLLFPDGRIVGRPPVDSLEGAR